MRRYLPTLHLLWMWLIFLTKQALCSKTNSYKWEVSLRESSDLSQHGIVEISKDGKVWATVYPSQRGWRVGSVVCRQLGLGPLSRASIVYDAMESVLYSVTCNGKENSLEACSVDTHSSLSYFSVLRIECLPVKAEEFDVALIKSYDFLDEGVVFIFVNGQWGPSCALAENQHMVCVTVCKQLDFADCSHQTAKFLGEILSDSVLDNVSCSTIASSLQDCDFHVIQRKTCTNHDGTFLEVACEKRYTYSSDIDFVFPTPPEVSPSSRYRTAFYLISLFIVTISVVLFYLRRKSRFDSSISMVSRISETRGDSQQEASLLPSYEDAMADGRYPSLNGHPPENGQPPGYSQVNSHTMDLQMDSTAQQGQVEACDTQTDPSVLVLSQSDPAAVDSGEEYRTSCAEVDTYIPGTGVSHQGMPSLDPELPTYEEAVARCNNET